MPRAFTWTRWLHANEDESFHPQFGRDPEGTISAEPNIRTCSYAGSTLSQSGCVPQD